MVKITETLIPANSKARPCRSLRAFKGVTIHETDNYNKGAGAKNHSLYKTVNGGWNSVESYHYVVDDKEAYRLVPENEITWHAGDGGNGTGNNETISIEICVNSDSNFSKACSNAAEITADILRRKGKTTARGWVYQHNNWSGKNCPSIIRKNNAWNSFLNEVDRYLNQGSVQTTTPSVTPGDTVLYRVRKSWTESSSQLGAYRDLNNAKECVDKNPGYSAFDPNGNVVYPVHTNTANVSSKKYVNLHAVRSSWAVYPLDKQPVTANACGHLNPKQYGGLSYLVHESLGDSVYVIETSSFGRVKIYCPGDNEGYVGEEPRYSKGNIGTASSTSSANTTPNGETEISRSKKNGTCYPNTTLNFRNAPNATTGKIEGQYYKGEFVHYDLVVETNLYTWVSWIGKTGSRRYMAVKQKSTGSVWAKC